MLHLEHVEPQIPSRAPGCRREFVIGCRPGGGAGPRGQSHSCSVLREMGFPVRNRQQRRSLAGYGDDNPRQNRYPSGGRAKGNALEAGTKNCLPGEGSTGWNRDRPQDRAEVVQTRSRLRSRHHLLRPLTPIGPRGRPASRRQSGAGGRSACGSKVIVPAFAAWLRGPSSRRNNVP